jgi:hypothetical protein
MALITGSTAFSNTPLITNTTFETFDGWIFGANRFIPADTWKEYVTAPDAFEYATVFTDLGAGDFKFTRWDDGLADKIETFMLHEFGAGPVGSGTDSVFQTGDVIRFTGKASAVVADASDTIARAFIKVLGYNELQWAFQTKQEYSAFHNIGAASEAFDLSVTFPDLAVDDSLQVLQIGFEATGVYDGSSAIDSVEITFSDIAAYVEGTGTTTWAGYDVDEGGNVDTTPWLGFINVLGGDYVWSYSLSNWMYLPEGSVSESGAWIYILNPTPAPAN